MTTASLPVADTGLEVYDIRGNAVFASRPVRFHDVGAYMEGIQRIAHAFAATPQTILRELVEVAVALCGADSAGISIEREGATDADFYHWVATAGEYSGFLNATLPRYPSACGICLERGEPQHFLVGQNFFDILNVEAPLVTDGILLPWQVEDMRGTIFVMAHHRSEAFDLEDCRIMKLLADFAATGVRQQRLQEKLMAQASAAAAAAMANDLAHAINNPLQSLTNIFYLAATGHIDDNARTLGEQASEHLERLNSLVRRLLALPYPK